MSEKIPAYPVVHVSMQPDGSAHVNVAGQHVDYPPAELEVTRAEVITYAVDVAARLGRAVRMTTTDPDGEWKLGVYPDGEVIDINPAPTKGRGPAKKPAQTTRPSRATQPVSSTSSTVVLERVPEVTTTRAAAPRVPRRAAQPAGTPVATLKFSTGDAAVIGAPAIIGRHPEAGVDDAGDVQLVTVHDKDRNVSRVHADVAWVGAKLILTDRGAGNGTAITRQPAPQFQLQPGKPYELRSGDVVHFGTVVTCAVTVSYLQDGATR